MKCPSESTESHRKSSQFLQLPVLQCDHSCYVYVDAKQLSLTLVFNSQFHAKYLASSGAYHGSVNQSECEILCNYAILTILIETNI